LTPPQIGVGPKIILFSNTFHTSKVFATSTTIFEDTHCLTKIYSKNKNSIEHVKGTSVIPVSDTSNQPIEEIKTD
jgi:hypothetical protein